MAMEEYVWMQNFPAKISIDSLRTTPLYTSPNFRYMSLLTISMHTGRAQPKPRSIASYEYKYSKHLLWDLNNKNTK